MAEISIKSREELEAWLQDKPVEWARAIAHRAAMRVLPLVAEVWKRDAPLERKQGLTLAAFSASLISRAAVNRPDYDMVPFLKAASARIQASHFPARYSDAASRFAADAARGAADVARGSGSTSFEFLMMDVFVAIARSRAKTRISATAAAWKAISSDAALLAGQPEAQASQQARALLGKTLWHWDAPEWAIEAYIDLLNIGDDSEWTATPQLRGLWDNWTNWYSAVSGIDGSAPRNYFSPELEPKIATQDDEWWDRGAAAVNADIAEWNLPKPSRTDPKVHSDRPAEDIDFLGRSEIAFILAGRLNSVWDQLNAKRDQPETRLEDSPGFVVHEPPRVCRRLFRLSHAAMAGFSSMA